MPAFNALTLIQMDGLLTLNEFYEALNMAKEACKIIYERQKQVLKSKYYQIKELIETEGEK
jgi:exosome complex component RRP41